MSEQKEWGELQQVAAQIGERGDKDLGDEDGPINGGRRQRPRAEAKAQDENDGSSPPPKATAGGWGEESTPSEAVADQQPKGRRRFSLTRGGSSALEKPDTIISSTDGESKVADDGRSTSQRRFADDIDENDDDDGDVIMIIPDLDDEQEEDLAFKVAEAPKNVRQVQSLQELNKNIQGLELPTNPADERIDISLLSSVLAPRELLEEPDDHWEFEALLEELSQAMTTDKESHEEMEKMMGVKGKSTTTTTTAPVLGSASGVTSQFGTSTTSRGGKGRRSVGESKA